MIIYSPTVTMNSAHGLKRVVESELILFLFVAVPVYNKTRGSHKNESGIKSKLFAVLFYSVEEKNQQPQDDTQEQHL
jgi:hypothetical protein